MRRHAGAQADEPLVRFADVEVDIPARRIVRGDEEIHLTPIEFRLLVVLLNNPGKVLTQRQLLGVAVRFAAMYVVLTYFLLS